MLRHAVLLAFLFAGTAHAQSRTSDDDLARSHFDSGRAYFAQARYEDAAREFEEAFRLSHRLPLLLNLSRALEEANRNEEAIDALDRWLAESPSDDPGRAETVSRRERLVSELEAQRSGTQGSTRDSGGEHDDEPESEMRPTHPHRALGIGLLSGGAALGATAVVTGLVAHGIHGDLEAGCPEGRCPVALADDLDRGRRLAATSTVTTFGSVALVGVGLTLALLRGDPESPAGLVVVPTASRDSFSVTLHARF